MQKLLKRTKQAEKQIARRKALRKGIDTRAEGQQDFSKRMQALKEANRSLVDARRRRREDYELGPLAPRRDTPVKDENGAFWGSISLSRSMSELGQRQLNLACQWAGGSKFLCLKTGDRVAIMQGPDRGKIGTVQSLAANEGLVVLSGDHLQQNVTISDVLIGAKIAEEGTYTELAPLRVPIQAVRLVHPLRDPATGKVRDVIVNELRPRNIVLDKPTGRVTWNRVVPGLNIEIPWPRAFEDAERNELEKTLPDHECDTLRIDVEEQTFVPSLLKPPMPMEIIDELRNKYSKFRTRHEPEYIARKEQEAAAKLAARGKSPTMRTPLKELNAKLREEKKALPQPVLTNAMLEKIGQFMFNAQQANIGVKTRVKSDDPEGQTPPGDSEGVRSEVKAEQSGKEEGASQGTESEIRERYMSKTQRMKNLARLQAKGVKAEHAPEATPPPLA